MLGDRKGLWERTLKTYIVSNDLYWETHVIECLEVNGVLETLMIGVLEI